MTPTDLRLPRPDLDPTRHWLVYPRHEPAPGGRGSFQPIPLDKITETYRPMVEAGAETDAGRVRNDSGIVVISDARATAIAALLEELALRLKPGIEVGPIQSDGSLSRLARELAEDMYKRADP